MTRRGHGTHNFPFDIVLAVSDKGCKSVVGGGGSAPFRWGPISSNNTALPWLLLEPAVSRIIRSDVNISLSPASFCASVCQVVISGFISALRAPLYLSACVALALTVVKLITGTNEHRAFGGHGVLDI